MRASGYIRALDDYYVEPAWLVDALLAVERFDGVCWDPACGGGTIPKALAAHGLSYHASDAVDRGYGTTGVDFLTATQPADNIISNPPYGIIEPFVERALLLAQQKVAIVARLAFLEGQGRRDGLFKRNPISRVWVSSRRASMPPGGTDIPAKNGTTAYAWFVWDRAYIGKTVLDHLP